MNQAGAQRALPSSQSLLIEGYASLFGVADASGDVVRAGAFSRSLKAGGVPMLLQHRSGAVVGRWVRLIEDGRGLYVRGLVESAGARSLVRSSLQQESTMTPGPSIFAKVTRAAWRGSTQNHFRLALMIKVAMSRRRSLIA